LTVQKVLPDQPGDARGEKRSKRFHERTLPLLSVLLELSDVIDKIEIVDKVSVALQRRLACDRRFLRDWNRCFEAKGEAKPRFLSIAFASPARNEIVVRIAKQLGSPQGAARPGPREIAAQRAGTARSRRPPNRYGGFIDYGTDVMVLVIDLNYLAAVITDTRAKPGPPAKLGRVRRQPQPPEEPAQPPEEPPEEEIQEGAE
jgi:hypothetical protein